MARVIALRELRDEFTAVMDAVEGGENFVVTRNGRPVAEIRPVRHRAGLTTSELKRALAGCAAADYLEMRAEVDALFGEDRLSRAGSPRPGRRTGRRGAGVSR